MKSRSKREALKRYNIKHRLALIIPVSIWALMATIPNIPAILGLFMAVTLGVWLGSSVERLSMKSFRHSCFSLFLGFDIIQRSTSIRNFLEARLLKDPRAYYKMNAVNFINQLPVYNTDNKKQVYNFYSQAYTVRLIRWAKRQNYIDKIDIVDTHKYQNLHVYRMALGLGKQKRKYHMYNAYFTLADSMDKPKTSLRLINAVGLDNRRFKIVKEGNTYYLRMRYGNIIADRLKRDESKIKLEEHARMKVYRKHN